MCMRGPMVRLDPQLDSCIDYVPKLFSKIDQLVETCNRYLCVPAGIIAVVIFTILCTLVFLIRYMFRHKGTYHTNEAKGSGESAGESADTAIIGTDNPETIDESKKEWFI